MLYHLDQESLSHTLFPLGSYSKDQTRKFAADAGFEVAEKPEVRISVLFLLAIMLHLSRSGKILKVMAHLTLSQDLLWIRKVMS
mgnify:FL=1